MISLKRTLISSDDQLKPPEFLDQPAPKVAIDIHKSLQAVAIFLESRGETAGDLNELDRHATFHDYIVAFKQAQGITQNLASPSDRLEAVEMLVNAWQQLTHRSEVQYRLARRGIQQRRHLRATPEEMKLELSRHMELGEQHIESQKGLFLIKMWQKRLECMTNARYAPNSVSATSA